MTTRTNDTQVFLSSPEYVKTSLAASISLGMEQGRFTRSACCTCLNLLLNYESGCYANCGYCGLAAGRSRSVRPSFIRVKWPVYPLGDIISKLQEEKSPFKRICVSMVTHPRAVADCCEIIRTLSEKTDIPISALLTPTVMNGEADMTRIREAGADKVGIAIDTATRQLFEELRGSGVGGVHQWEQYNQMVDTAVSVFGRYMAGVHLIAGLGETDRDMVDIISRFHKRGALTHLFSFYPEQGSLLENHPRPSIGRYRRLQLARYLINTSVCDGSDFVFSESGELVDFGVDISQYIEKGIPFMTSGCAGKDGSVACNRPFSNERPSEPIRNYHFMPDNDDKTLIYSQIFEDIHQLTPDENEV